MTNAHQANIGSLIQVVPIITMDTMHSSLYALIYSFATVITSTLQLFAKESLGVHIVALVATAASFGGIFGATIASFTVATLAINEIQPVNNFERSVRSNST
jgi:hypothetical protein